MRRYVKNKEMQEDPQAELLHSLKRLVQQNIPKSLRMAAERQITRIQLGVFEG
ncbi:MAG: hypothetical protein HQM14_08925 [SAR324 cluster bacterium]|nr:hypothetical protein [SAR324 cluster bacterium]